MQKLRGQLPSTTPTQQQLQQRAYQDALFANTANPPLRERIGLPANLLASYRGDAPLTTGPTWEGKANVPAHVAEATTDWGNPTGAVRAGFGREPQIDKSIGAEQCYQHMNRWLNRCVLTPM